VLIDIAPRGEHFLLTVPFAADKPVTVGISTQQHELTGNQERRAAIGKMLDTALSVAFPFVRHSPVESSEDGCWQARGIEILPSGQLVDESSFKALGLRTVPSGNETSTSQAVVQQPGICVARDLARRPDLLALGHLMASPDFAAITVTLQVTRFERDVGLKRLLNNTYRPLADSISRHAAHELAAKDGFGHALLAHLTWLNAGACQRVTAWAHAHDRISPVLLDMLCLAIYGVPRSERETEAQADLTRAWPDCNLSWLERLPEMLEAKRKLAQRAALRTGAQTGARLGRQTDGGPLVLSAKARAQHLFIIGQTGTGKTTEIANLVAQDMEAGEAVVVFDAHGDLANDCLRMVPPSRQKDLIFLHPTDPRGEFTLNILEPLGSRTAVEHNRTANDLINLFKRIYPEPKEAYGPMFMSYARNAIFLLLSANGTKATILDIARVFADASFRRELTKTCARPDVRQFWEDIAEDVRSSGENASIDNVAPYIVAKLTQLSGNEILIPIIGAQNSSVDFRKVVGDKRICIINLALPEIGEEDAKILGGLLFSRLTASLQVQAKLAPTERIPLRVYLDEVQTYADETLAQSMAQMRKFGLTYTLACQNFAQIDGGGWRPDVGRAILGNAANLILFRLGYFDANMLAAYMAPTVTPQDLLRMPNYHAAARLLSSEGQPVEAIVFETDPPRG
jgi:hypothetical protein